MKQKSPGFGQSIAGHLFKTIFGFYLMLAIVVTVIQLTAEYYQTKKDIIQEMQKLPDTFGPGISAALWTYNDRLLQSILKGMHEIHIISGVDIQDNKGKNIRSVGSVFTPDGDRVFFDEDGSPGSNYVGETAFSKLFGHEFIISQTDFDGNVHEIGKGVIYSESGVIIDRVRYGFFLILFNSLVKTFGLWLIFLFFVKKYLGHPLGKLTREIESIDVENLEHHKIDISLPLKNELGILKNAFDRMINKLNTQVVIIKQARDYLEVKVAERTKELSETNLTLKNEVVERKKAQKVLQKKTRELKESLENVKTLSDLLPICSKCKNIRDDKGYWERIDVYIQQHSDTVFSHGICPDCEEELYGKEEWYKELKKRKPR